jgi:co-chaperonin GroES (HSP10)
MAVVVPNKGFAVLDKSTDPKKDILDFFRGLSPKVRPTGNEVLVATYLRPEKTKGGIYRPDANKEEDIWQGKVGLIVKMGPEAFVDSAEYKFHEESRCKIGDWVYFVPNGAWALPVSGFPCRQMKDTNIRGRLDDPDIIF